ncbi:MAG: FHA domain-containing protein [Ruminococcaceae bacterium]|nr:FHA domain-containing protein [Oscillospiraceae bacterium]
MYIVYNSEYISVYDDLIGNCNVFLFPFFKELNIDENILNFTAEDNVDGVKLCCCDFTHSFCIKINGEMLATRENLIKHNDLIEILNPRINKSFYVLYLSNYSEKYSVVKLNESITIGRSSSCDIIIEHPAISRQHAQITPNAHSVAITKLSSNGYMYVNGFEFEEKSLDFGDAVRIMGTLIIFMGEYVIIYGEHTVSPSCTTHTIKECDDEITHWVFNSAPRILRSVDYPRIVIDPPTPLSPQKPVPFILAVGPSLTMSLAMLVSTSVGLSSVIKEGINSTFTPSLMFLKLVQLRPRRNTPLTIRSSWKPWRRPDMNSMAGM